MLQNSPVRAVRGVLSLLVGFGLGGGGSAFAASADASPSSSAPATASHSTAPIRVLYFTKSSGWEHSVVKRGEGGAPSHSERILAQLAAKHGLALTFSKDGSVFSPEYFAPFDVLFFYTSGDLAHPGTDGTPPITPAGKQALLDAIAGGKGFVGVHSTCDSFHFGETGAGVPKDTSNRWVYLGPKADPFTRMLGGEFLRHGAEQVARARVIDSKFPGCEALDGFVELKEEWYSLKEFAPDMHVLLVLESEKMDGRDYQRPQYPVAWTKAHGRGRVWFNAMGHREDVWENEKFHALLLGGIRWAAKRADADTPPNLTAVTPQAETLPPLK